MVRGSFRLAIAGRATSGGRARWLGIRRKWLRHVGTLPYGAQLALMLLPLLAGLLLLVILPLALVLAVAFTDYDALTPPRWTGLRNVELLLRDPEFWNGLRASLGLAAAAVPLRIAGALLLALLLQRPEPGVGAVRAAVYVPTVVPDVAYALLWLYLFNPLFGPVNDLLLLLAAPFGLRPAGWLLDPVTAQAAVVVMLAWTVGEGFVVLLAALQDIPRELHEAAALDGAGAWARFRAITLPLVVPLLLLLACRDTLFSFRASFVAAVIVTRGGPYYATAYLPFWIYTSAVDQQRYGYAAAMTLVVLALTAGLIALQFWLVRRWRAAYFYD